MNNIVVVSHEGFVFIYELQLFGFYHDVSILSHSCLHKS